METINLDDFIARVDDRAKVLGIVDTEDRTEGLRNKGHSRTPEKRELLRRTQERAIAAGLQPMKAYF